MIMASRIPCAACLCAPVHTERPHCNRHLLHASFVVAGSLGVPLHSSKEAAVIHVKLQTPWLQDPWYNATKKKVFPLISSTGAFQNGTAYTQDAYTATQASYVPSPPAPPPTPTPAIRTGPSSSDVSLRTLSPSIAHVHHSLTSSCLQGTLTEVCRDRILEAILCMADLFLFGCCLVGSLLLVLWDVTDFLHRL